MARADANKDAKITADELLAAANSAFDEHDKAQVAKLEEEAFGELLTALFPLPAFGPPPGGPPQPPNPN